MTKVDLKIVLLGQQHVGKSCLVDRCVLINNPTLGGCGFPALASIRPLSQHPNHSLNCPSIANEHTAVCASPSVSDDRQPRHPEDEVTVSPLVD
jgi:hypothetical protein